MKHIQQYWQRNTQPFTLVVIALIGLFFLLFYRLGSLTGGLSSGELQAAVVAVGWHGIYHSPLYLPLKLVRSIVFYLFPAHGQVLTRLPNTIFGGLTIASFGWLVWLWHGRRTALLCVVLFATSAWVLHVSRLASYDIMYLWGMTSLLLSHALIGRHNTRPIIWYGVLLLWGLLLTIPGLVWFIVLELYMQRAAIRESWSSLQVWWQRPLSIILLLLWLPLIALDLGRSGQLVQWLGLPTRYGSPGTILKQFIGVFVHLFARGPEYPTLWVGRAALLDGFSLAMCALGIYFYASRWQTGRSRMLGLSFLLGVILVTLGGPVGLSILVPLLYVAIAMGIAYFLHEWLVVFPANPLARSLGIGLIVVAVAFSCLYNLRNYFVAWPHNDVTQTAFRYHR